MSQPVLQVSNLTCYLGTARNPVRAVDGVSFDIHPGETFALLGESGCGKSMTALSLMRLLPPSAWILDGSSRFKGTDLLKLPEAQMKEVRGRGMSMIFQEPMTSLNPVMTIGRQIMEAMEHLKETERKKKAVELLDLVGIPAPEQRIGDYPHQLSGGMKQRVVIAIALANEPDVLIADEPTTALDVTIQAQVLDLIRDLQKQRGMGLLLITHDLGVANELADTIGVMYAGQIVERGDHGGFFASPLHPYSKQLFDSLPTMEKRDQGLSVIPGSVPSLRACFDGCRFAPRCSRALDICANKVPSWSSHDDGQVRCHLYTELQANAPSNLHEGHHAARPQIPPVNVGNGEPLLGVAGLKVYFPIKSGFFQRTAGFVRAVDGIHLEIPRGRTLALVGESGCGKTTVGKGILQLIKPTGGSVSFEGTELTRVGRKEMKRRRSEIQIVFQDPYSSMDPRMLVGDIITEGLRTQSLLGSETENRDLVHRLLERVGLPADASRCYPHEFSGGQRQRISIARALAVGPKLIVCDEPTSALDVSVQAQILNLLQELQQDTGISYLFITHNISVVAYLAHEVAVMYLGRIVEHGPVGEVLNTPQHPYTRALLSAVPVIDQTSTREIIRLKGDMPSPSNPPDGCFFHPRCSRVMDICRVRYPQASRISDEHVANCHLFTQGQ